MRESHDPAAWWRRAQRDLEAARVLAQQNIESLPDVICSICQQACEKMLKAYLLSHEWVLVPTHDLEALGQEAEKLLPALRELLPDLVGLSADFVPSRYPFDESEGFTSEDAQQSLSTTEQLHSLLRDRFESAEPH